MQCYLRIWSPQTSETETKSLQAILEKIAILYFGDHLKGQRQKIRLLTELLSPATNECIALLAQWIAIISHRIIVILFCR
jgi:hypothetical protein